MPTDMLAARLIVSENRLVMDRVPVPEPGPGQALVKVRAAGVCLSDVHLLDGTLSPLFLDGDVVTLGHEVAGTIDALGDGAAGFSLGQRVLLEAGQVEPDGRLFTRGVDYDGGWAEYALARADTLVPIPDSLPFEQAAIVPDAVSTPWSAVTSSGRVRPGEAVGVWGLGGLGTHAVQLLRLVGAAPVIALDPVEAARTRALDLGADLALDPSSPDVADQVRHATQGCGIDVAFDFAGAVPVREQALALLAPQGRLVLVGLAGEPVTIPHDVVFSFRRQAVIGAYGSEPQHLRELVRLVERGRLDLGTSVTATLPLVEAPQAVEQLQKKVGNPVRIVLRP
jgi:D-arabinose 1-dehydrogenase-like Zn-dependent alcohol dehydrogenase